mgnify:CR=1 FL=1
MADVQKILFVAGTRPEIIKISPLIKSMRESREFHPFLLFTSQHTDLGMDFLSEFALIPDIVLDPIRDPTLRLARVHNQVVGGTSQACLDLKPDVVLVQGDTISAAAGANAAFLSQVAVGHIEAGLRTFDLYNPFPEEWARRVVAQSSTWHFAPTEGARRNLLAEGHPETSIFVTGNTGIDSVRLLTESSRRPETHSTSMTYTNKPRRTVLITLHRRELESSTDQLDLFLERAFARFADIDFVAVHHPNGLLSSSLSRLREPPNLQVFPPQTYRNFITLMNNSDAVISDSGGVQEEATYLNVPLLVLRESTERAETLERPNSRQCPISLRALDELERLLSLPPQEGLSYRHSFGDGHATERILSILEDQRRCA